MGPRTVGRASDKARRRVALRLTPLADLWHAPDLRMSYPRSSVAQISAPNPSYRALLEVPSLGRVLLSMQVSRIAQSMVGIVMILFALQRYDSPQLAGVVAFASIAPGMVISPIAGALLDRHGRIRLIILDYIVAVQQGARNR